MNRYLREDFVMKDGYMATSFTLEDATSHRAGQPGYNVPWAFIED